MDNNGSSEVAEALCGTKACKGRAVDEARVAGEFRGAIVCSNNSGVFLLTASA